MKIARCFLKSVSPYSQGRRHRDEKLAKELSDDYEARTWRSRLWANEQGYVFIPPMQLANSLKEAAKYLSLPIPGKGKQLFTKHFEAGVMVADPLVLPIKVEDVTGEWVDVPSDGRRGGTTRVPKCFGVIPSWEGEVNYYILDDIITREPFEKVLKTSGSLIGIGRFRPRNWGYYGRFQADIIEFESV